MTGNKSVDNIILAIALLATAATVGMFVYTEMIFKKPLPSDAVELQKLKDDNKFISRPESLKLDKITINLPSRTKRLRFLDVQIHLVYFKNKDRAALEEITPIINDIIIDVGSNMSPDELNSIAGKLIFENRVKSKINDHFQRPVVKELFYTKFVVQ